MACAICETRRPRRFCPGVRGNICSVCCGTEREMTVDCPLDCEFLREARRHEKLEPINPDALPNAEIQLSHKFLEENEHLLIFLGRTIAMAARDPGGIVDFDVRDALDGLIRTYRTLQSGVYYDSVPAGPRAAELYRLV